MLGGGLGGFAPGEWTDDTSMAIAVLEVAARRHELVSDEALTNIARVAGSTAAPRTLGSRPAMSWPGLDVSPRLWNSAPRHTGFTKRRDGRAGTARSCARPLSHSPTSTTPTRWLRQRGPSAT